MQKSLLFLFLFSSFFGFSQKKLDKLLKAHNTESIPYIYIEDLKSYPSDIILLDARESKEYATSHLKDAIPVGYDFFNMDSVLPKLPDKDSKIVVYCSLGIRSEDIAEKLKKAGYKNIFNLYGGIFEWKNNNLKVYNLKEQETDSVHTFNKDWSKWLKKGIKIYE
ncbi:rhodanese-like domain-containing protein [Seonamhaeicola sp.]|uniref:rhodanese-like domain-containing protein n=1 Tax=Seonamhaeicola sp. TaxID=1912245 RepID=UPI00261443F9|nr:rhodanese-like domain-containing protein [Seonamhaeicola sp.]